MIRDITPLILTYNEAPNIGRTLAHLGWAGRIVVVDSGSDDRTLEILRTHPSVEVVYRTFDSHARQWNFGLSQIRTEWVLTLDADYELSDAMITELAALEPPPDVAGYAARFVYRVFGHNLRGTLYPPRTVLFRVARGRYVDEGHTQSLCLEGERHALTSPIYHDDRKPLARWRSSQQAYAQREVDYLLAQAPASLPLADRLRLRMWPAPPLALLYTLFVKGVVLNGWPGWYYALQRTYAEVGLALELLDRRLRPKSECVLTPVPESTGGDAEDRGSASS